MACRLVMRSYSVLDIPYGSYQSCTTVRTLACLLLVFHLVVGPHGEEDSFNIAGPTVTVRAPGDLNDHCPQWAKDGECATNGNFMLSHCAASCAMWQHNYVPVLYSDERALYNSAKNDIDASSEQTFSVTGGPVIISPSGESSISVTNTGLNSSGLGGPAVFAVDQFGKFQWGVSNVPKADATALIDRLQNCAYGWDQHISSARSTQFNEVNENWETEWSHRQRRIDLECDGKIERSLVKSKAEIELAKVEVRRSELQLREFDAKLEAADAKVAKLEAALHSARKESGCSQADADVVRLKTEASVRELQLEAFVEVNKRRAENAEAKLERIEKGAGQIEAERRASESDKRAWLADDERRNVELRLAEADRIAQHAIAQGRDAEDRANDLGMAAKRAEMKARRDTRMLTAMRKSMIGSRCQRGLRTTLGWTTQHDVRVTTAAQPSQHITTITLPEAAVRDSLLDASAQEHVDAAAKTSFKSLSPIHDDAVVWLSAYIHGSGIASILGSVLQTCQRLQWAFLWLSMRLGAAVSPGNLIDADAIDASGDWLAAFFLILIWRCIWALAVVHLARVCCREARWVVVWFSNVLGHVCVALLDVLDRPWKL